MTAGNLDNDGFVANWNLVKSIVQHQKGEGYASVKDREQDIQYAWDENKCYIRVAETTVDNNPIEGADSDEWAAAPYTFDGVAFFNLPNAGNFPNNNGALCIGMSSDGLERINSGAARHSVLNGKRISEAQVLWSDIAPNATIAVGYFFRSDPLILDSDTDNWTYLPGGDFIWDASGQQNSQSFVGGNTWAVTGELNYTTVHLGAFSDISKDHTVNFQDFAKIASGWLQTNCGKANGFCGGDDFWPLGSGDGKVDFHEIMQLATEWLN